ncbi:hypothetical protein L596_022474 [Steinernema carpocapsae]|uniref:Uncharacterized protein n=1 Tax=Steinernema carpocapsae TaxID=34508 RepID=A0A4U5MLW3_STECR|nr:hypothetical protein L596_022474 [Steinernema carpocapsae]
MNAKVVVLLAAVVTGAASGQAASEDDCSHLKGYLVIGALRSHIVSATYEDSPIDLFAVHNRNLPEDVPKSRDTGHFLLGYDNRAYVVWFHVQRLVKGRGLVVLNSSEAMELSSLESLNIT